MSYLGMRIESDTHPGLLGLVVNRSEPERTWPRRRETYDVLWDDGECSRRIAVALLEAGDQWRLRPEEPKRSQEACKSIWWDWVRDNCRKMEARRAVTRSDALAPSLPVAAVVRQPASDPSRGHELYHSLVSTGLATEATAAPSPTSAREVRARAGDILSDRFPGTDFGLNCERRVLLTAWMDGPLPGMVWSALQPLVDGRSLERVKPMRAISETLAQSACRYVLWRTASSEVVMDQMALRVSGEAYLGGRLDSLRVDSGIASGLTYVSLINCVLERWDGEAGRFRDSRRTQGLQLELAALFPDGNEGASAHFRQMRAETDMAMANTQITLNAASQRTREQQRG